MSERAIMVLRFLRVHVIAMESWLARQDGPEIDVSLGTEMTLLNS
jgi:hypothetical protein